MVSRNYYEVLGVNRGDDEKTIKAAYRKMALKYHPDRNLGDKQAEEKFKEAANAYSVLSDPEKKTRYDQFGHSGVEGPGEASGFHNVSDIFDSFGDIFSSFFDGTAGGGFGRGFRQRQRGQDFRYHLEVGLETILEDSEQVIQFGFEDVCKKCKGTGAYEGRALKTCSYCGGQGQVHQKQGFFFMSTTCKVCHGLGQQIEKKCKNCRGTGQSEAHRKIKVKIPKGISSGTQLRLAGEGGSGQKGAPSGDLYVEIFVKHHKKFERRGEHLIARLKISYLQALLGAKIKVKNLRGQTKELTLPKGTKHNDTLRLRGEGLYSRGFSKGDLLFHVAVEWPEKLNKKEEKLLREIADIKRENVSK